MIKISSIILLLSAICVDLFATSVSIQESYYDYHDKFPDEKDTKITAVLPKVGRATIIGSIEDINRYGLNAQQAGVEIYSNIGNTDDKIWGYSTLYLANKDFLPKYDFSAALFKGGIFGNSEIGFGYKRMSYVTQSTDIFKGIVTFPAFIIPSTTIMETFSIIPENNTHSLNSKIIYNNEKDTKMFYSYTFGNTSEDFGFLGVKKIDQTSHIIGIEHEVYKKITFGVELLHESYKDFYNKTGGNVSLRLDW